MLLPTKVRLKLEVSGCLQIMYQSMGNVLLINEYFSWYQMTIVYNNDNHYLVLAIPWLRRIPFQFRGQPDVHFEHDNPYLPEST